MAGSERVTGTIRGFLRKQRKSDEVGADTPLGPDGIGLDSLQTAELAAMLYEELGRDPFTEGERPTKVGEIIDFYEE